MLVFVGGKDDVSGRRKPQKSLISNKSSDEIILKEYENAYHCFDWEIDMMWNGNRLQYNPEASADAVSRTQEFLEEAMKQGIAPLF